MDKPKIRKLHEIMTDFDDNSQVRSILSPLGSDYKNLIVDIQEKEEIISENVESFEKNDNIKILNQVNFLV